MLGWLVRLVGALPVAVAVIAGATAPTVAWVLTATVLAVGGLGFPTVDEATMRAALGGRFSAGNTFVNVPWPGQIAPVKGTVPLGESVAVGVDNLYAAILATPGPKIATGVSGSTMVVNEVMRRLVNDPLAPPPDELSFLVVGDAERGIFRPFRGVALPILDYTPKPIPVTPYDVTVVVGEYDGLGDWPDRPNPLAMANALAGTGIFPGFGSVHWSSIWVDPAAIPPGNITTKVNAKGGTTTTYRIPTPDLPLLQPLRDQGMPEAAVDALNALLKPVVDAGYSRGGRGEPFTARPGSPVRTSVRALAARPAGATADERPGRRVATSPPAGSG